MAKQELKMNSNDDKMKVINIRTGEEKTIDVAGKIQRNPSWLAGQKVEIKR
jgi:hypothetical protein